MEPSHATRAAFDVLEALIQILAARGVISPTDVLVLAAIAERCKAR